MNNTLTYSEVKKAKLSLEKYGIERIIGAVTPLEFDRFCFKGCCPFCHKKSLIVSNEINVFKCFSCGEGGDILSFLYQLEKRKKGEAQLLIDKTYNHERVKNINCQDK